MSLLSAAQVRGPVLCRENPAQSSCQGVELKLGLVETERLKRTVFPNTGRLMYVYYSLDRLPTSTIGRSFRNREVHASWQDMSCLTWPAKTWGVYSVRPRHPHVCLELSGSESDSRGVSSEPQDMAKGYPGNPRVFESGPRPARSQRLYAEVSRAPRPDPRISMPAGQSRAGIRATRICGSFARELKTREARFLDRGLLRPLPCGRRPRHQCACLRAVECLLDKCSPARSRCSVTGRAATA